MLRTGLLQASSCVKPLLSPYTFGLNGLKALTQQAVVLSSSHACHMLVTRLSHGLATPSQSQELSTQPGIRNVAKAGAASMSIMVMDSAPGLRSLCKAVSVPLSCMLVALETCRASVERH